MLDKIKREATDRMGKAVDKLKQEYKHLRTGRANAGLLDHIKVDYYGAELPISQTANVVVEDARTISITPWEKPMVGAIEKAILASDLGITPNTAGGVIRIIMPPLTEERRKDLVKVVKHEAEQARIAIRNVRRDANQEIKELGKKKVITTDEEKRGETEIQKLTDQFIAKVDEAAAAKEKDLMSM
ncbi:MAG: ribosome recycling factor [Gammaproteobacteria bacterium]|nr:ribosome recycling factor [Gammaproteobacteria bacterium]